MSGSPSNIVTRRVEFPVAVRRAAWDRAGGVCETCEAKLFPGNINYDHDVPTAMGGEATLENCKVLCLNCHGAKTTKKDVPLIARVQRKARKNVGAGPVTRNPIQGGRKSHLKKMVDGRVIDRRTGKEI